MQTQGGQGPWWAALTVWAVVNAVNILQSVGFLSRIRTGTMTLNRQLGYLMFALGVPAAIALVGFIRARAGLLSLLGPAVYIAFLTLMLVVDYVAPVEFRSPHLYGVLVPYLVLFFGSILLMGLPMYGTNRSYWLVTVVTSVLLIGSMVGHARGGRMIRPCGARHLTRASTLMVRRTTVHTAGVRSRRLCAKTLA